mgnify:CR=1 FL=1
MDTCHGKGMCVHATFYFYTEFTGCRFGYLCQTFRVTAPVETKILPMPNIKNVFLDDDLLSEVRICQAM